MRRVGANLLAMMRCTVYKSTVALVLDYCSSITVELNKALRSFTQAVKSGNKNYSEM